MLRAAAPRLCNLTKGTRVVQSARKMSSKRNIPVFSPWRSRRYDDHWDKFISEFPTRSPFRALDERFRDAMDRMEMVFWPPFSGYHHRHHHHHEHGGKTAHVSEVRHNNKVYEVVIDASEFTPEELTVKMHGDLLTISGKHEKKPDEHGYITREFSREFIIPEDVDMDTMSSHFTGDGNLVVKGRIKGADNSTARTIDIERDPQDTEKN